MGWDGVSVVCWGTLTVGVSVSVRQTGTVVFRRMSSYTCQVATHGGIHFNYLSCLKFLSAEKWDIWLVTVRVRDQPEG